MYVEKLRRQIAEHEQEPAERVFKNTQWLKGVPAGRLLLIMNRGYSRAASASSETRTAVIAGRMTAFYVACVASLRRRSSHRRPK